MYQLWRAGREARKKKEVIHFALRLEGGGETFRLPVAVVREQCTRAEIQGLLGNAQKDASKRFSLAALQGPYLSEQVMRIAQGIGPAELVIPCSETELDQFNYQTV